MQTLFAELDRPSRLSDRVSSQLEELIGDGSLRSGDRLPPERELGEQFGVSRTVIREAVRALVAKGLLEVRAGAGTVVRHPSSGIVSEALARVLRTEPGAATYASLRQVRGSLEPDIAALAAARRRDDELRQMRHELDIMRNSETSPIDWAAADVGFHAALARASRNPIYGIILNSIQDLLLEVRLLADQLPDTRAKALHYHERIYKAVEAGSAVDARKAMVAHLREAAATQHLAFQRLSV